MKASAGKIADAVFSRVLGDIKPSRRELKESVYNINHLTSRLKEVVPKEVEIRVVGSVVRSTQLRGDSDIDIFLLFPKKYSREKITKDGLDYAKRIVKGKLERYEIKYAEHPYVRLYLEDLKVEADIVPAFNIDNIEDMGTAVDRSPMHADFINAHLSDKQRDEVRLLKYLLKTQNIYGAEVMTSGFSGYLCELLVYHYGSLFSLLQNAANFTMPLLLDPRTKTQLHDLTLIKRFNSDFVVIDPIDKNRNVAAGVSKESLARFVIVARGFVARPSVKFFFDGGFADQKVEKMLNGFIEDSGLDMLVVAVNVPDKSEDVIWPQLRKTSDYVTNEAERFGLNIYMSMPIISDRKGLLVFFAPQGKIRTRLLKGPSVFIKKAQEEFVNTHRNALGMLLKNDALYALDKSRYVHVKDLMRAVAEGRIVKRHKDIKLQGSRLFVNKVPHAYAIAIYAELLKKTNF